MVKIVDILILGVAFSLAGCTSMGHKLGLLDYQVGAKGPAGGFIFYDDEADGVDDLLGVRFLEAAPADLPGTYAWGGGHIFEGVDGYSLGSGAAATKAITTTYPDGSYAANACESLVVRGFDDWFLPSLDALKLVYAELKAAGLGDFSNERYLSAANDDPTSTDTIRFSDGGTKWAMKDVPFKVRAIRSF